MDIAPQSRGGRGTVQLVDLLEFAIQQTDDGIAIMRFTDDPEVPIRIVYANEAIERLSGYTSEELLDPSNPLLRVQSGNRAQYERHLNDVRAGRAVRFEIEFHGKNERRWCDIFWSPLRYKGGEVTHYVAVLRDTGERRTGKAERDRLYRAIEQAHDGLCIVDIPNGDVKTRRASYANDALCALLKTTREEIFVPGRVAEALFAEQPQLLDRYLREVMSGVMFAHDLHATCGDGSKRWIHVTASPVYSDSGRVEEMTITFEDIDDRKHREDQIALFESILSQTSDFVVTADTLSPSQGGPRITYANPAFAAIVGVDAREIPGKALTAFFSPNNDRTLLANVAERLERQQNISVELRIQHPSGETDLWIELSGHQVRGESARSASWFFIGKDISVRKQGYTQTAQLMTALDLAEEPISIYSVKATMDVDLEYMNESAAGSQVRLLEKMLANPFQRARIRAAWPPLEDNRSVMRLICSGEGSAKHWATLELRPMMASGKLGSLIAIEYALRLSNYDGHPTEVATMLALSREILGFEDHAERRDAFLEVLREEIGATASFSRTARVADVVLRVKDNNGYVVMPPGVFFERAVAVDLSWSGSIPPRRLTAFRIFLETLARSD